MDENKKMSMLKIFNILTLIMTLVVNALANILPLNNIGTGALSDALPNLFVPSGLTFSIWGVIYLLLFLFAVYQASKGDSENFLGKIGIWFILSNIFNTAWIFLWHWQYVGLSLIVMLLIFGTLLKIYLTLGIGKTETSKAETFFVRVTFSVYIGWITIATIANVTGYLVSISWDAFGISEEIWAIAILIIGFVIASGLILTRKDIAYGLVVIWAYYGIYLKRVIQVGDVPSVGITALVLLIIIGIEEIYNAYRILKK